MAETVENLVIRISSDVAEAKAGIQRLTDAVDKLSNSLDGATSSEKKSTAATKENTKETSKNEKEHKKAGESAKHHASGLAKIAAALKRILIYRAIRGLIKSVGTAIKEGIQRMYEWSEANDQVFMKVMDTYATEVQYLKDALGAALAPLIETLMPILVRLVDWFVELINKVQQFFRALAGYDDWLKVDKVTAKFAKDTDKAAKAQKALNTQLMDFDKLNLITTPKTSGKEEEETPPLTGHLEDIDPKIKKIADEVKKVIEDLKGVFGDLGDNSLISALKDLVNASNIATWELIKSVFTAIGIVADKLKKNKSLQKLIDGIKKLSVGGIENTTEFINMLIESGAMDTIGSILGDVFEVLGFIFTIIGKIAKTVTRILNTILKPIFKILNKAYSKVNDIFGKVFNAMDAENGIGALLGALEKIFDFVGWILDKVADVVNYIQDLVDNLMPDLLGEDGLSKVWYFVQKIGESFDGLEKIMNGDLWGGLKQLLLQPIIAAVRLIGQVVENVDKLFHPNDEEVNKKWKNFYDEIDRIEGKINGTLDTTKTAMSTISIEYDEFGHEIEKTTDNTLKNTKAYWVSAASSVGMTYDDLADYAKKKYGVITKESLTASVNEIRAANNAAKAEQDAIDKVVKASGKDYKTLATFAEYYYGKATSKTLKLSNDRINANERFSKNSKKTEESWLKLLKNLVREGKITYGDYDAYVHKLQNADKKTWFSVINEMAAKWKEFAKSGKNIGEAFRKGFLGELKKIEDTKITMKPGQQGQWNNAKITMETKAHGGYPSMGSMFVAGEVPGQAEFVGNINGRTGVASGAEITGIAEAVYGTGETEAMLLRQLIAAVRSQNLTISPSASLGKVVNQSQRLYAGVTG